MAVAARSFGGLFFGRIELHPDGELFFAEDFGGDLKQAIDAVAEQRLPQLADQG